MLPPPPPLLLPPAAAAAAMDVGYSRTPYRDVEQLLETVVKTSPMVDGWSAASAASCCNRIRRDEPFSPHATGQGAVSNPFV
jgi:hypothetical protein